MESKTKARILYVVHLAVNIPYRRLSVDFVVPPPFRPHQTAVHGRQSGQATISHFQVARALGLLQWQRPARW